MTASGLYMQPERENVPIGQEANNLLQGDAADTVFYIQTGKVRLTVVSKIGKEATLGEPG
jgi:CRP/FNR family cyclic AMP-dependent transcriptional regulator